MGWVTPKAIQHHATFPSKIKHLQKNSCEFNEFE